MVVLCEDRQHEVFVRKFLQKMGWQGSIRTEKAPPGEGSAEQFVKKQFVKELAEYRRNRNRVSIALVVMIDGDDRGPAERRAELEAACRKKKVPFVDSTERVLIVVPTWEIETWIAYLEKEDRTVNETTNDYPRLSKPRKCQPHVEKLAGMCRKKQLSESAPPSLLSACDEYNKRMAS